MASSVMPTPRRGTSKDQPAAVSATGLRKSYGDKLVLDGVDLHIPAGSVFALLGPNGSRQDHRRQDPLHAALRR